MKGSQYFLIIISILMVGIISLSLTYSSFDTKLLPIVFGSVVLVLCLIQLAKEVREKERAEKKSSKKDKDARDIGIRPYVSVATWIVGLVLGIYLVGFMVATPLYLISFIKLHGRGWVSALVTAGVSMALLYFVFVVALQLNLYRGLFFQ